MQSYLTSQLLRVLSEMEGVPVDFKPEFEQPASTEHGDLASNAPLKLARFLKRAPRQIAEDLSERLRALPLDPDRIKTIEVAGPGFLNFRYGTAYLFSGLEKILSEGSNFGRAERGSKGTAIVEFVSANPTGPLTVGHGRNAVLGDTIANLLSWTGFDVTREYYFNDAGRQMRTLGQSVKARYLAAVDPDISTKTIDSDGELITVPECFPDDGYLGEYIQHVASELFEKHGDSLVSSDSAIFKDAAEKRIFEEIKTTLGRLGIRMDSYFNEKDLYEDNKVWEIVESLRELDLAYDSEGAVWLRTKKFGKEKDTVLVKSTGEPTYRLPDIGYHIDKISRGFDLIVDVFGADHIATFPDVVNAVKALGHNTDSIDVVIYQFVTLVRKGKPVKMSTRKAQYVTLDELMDEVSEDVTRFFFLMRSANTHLEFDLDLAREASDTNPVFYLQYAHARICSIIRKAKEVGFTFSQEADFKLLTHDSEEALLKELLLFPDVIRRAAESREPHRISNYLREVASQFTQFYGQCRIIGETPDLASARMDLARASKNVLRNGLSVLGISAPEKM